MVGVSNRKQVAAGLVVFLVGVIVAGAGHHTPLQDVGTVVFLFGAGWTVLAGWRWWRTD